MATFKATGIEEYVRMLEDVNTDAEEDIKKAVYAGAEVIADSIKAALYTIPEHSDDELGSQSKPIRGLTAKEKSEVINGFGLAPMRNDRDYINTKAGFAGKSSTKTKTYPSGTPIVKLIRGTESGTSFRMKTPVIANAVARVKEEAIEAMQKSLEKSIGK